MEMTNVNSVIKGIECCKLWDDRWAYDGFNPDSDKCEICPYHNEDTSVCDCHERLLTDALDYLKVYAESCLPIRCERCDFMIDGKCHVRYVFCKLDGKDESESLNDSD